MLTILFAGDDEEKARLAEEGIDEALEALLDNEMAEYDEYDDSGSSDGDSGEDNVEEKKGGDNDDSNDESSDQISSGINIDNILGLSTNVLKSVLKEGLQGTTSTTTSSSSFKKEVVEKCDDEPLTTCSSSKPSNFSRINTSLSLDVLKKEFPLYYDLIHQFNDNTKNVLSNHKQEEISIIHDHKKSKILKNDEEGMKSVVKSYQNTLSINLDDYSSPNLSNNIIKSTSADIISNSMKVYDVHLKAGEMLYIPCGWFHEVESVGSGSGGGHMAFNYWFHPPDGETFDKPYKSDFWLNDWKKRQENGDLK